MLFFTCACVIPQRWVDFSVATGKLNHDLVSISLFSSNIWGSFLSYLFFIPDGQPTVPPPQFLDNGADQPQQATAEEHSRAWEQEIQQLRAQLARALVREKIRSCGHFQLRKSIRPYRSIGWRNGCALHLGNCAPPRHSVPAVWARLRDPTSSRDPTQ